MHLLKGNVMMCYVCKIRVTIFTWMWGGRGSKEDHSFVVLKDKLHLDPPVHCFPQHLVVTCQTLKLPVVTSVFLSTDGSMRAKVLPVLSLWFKDKFGTK